MEEVPRANPRVHVPLVYLRRIHDLDLTTNIGSQEASQSRTGSVLSPQQVLPQPSEHSVNDSRTASLLGRVTYVVRSPHRDLTLDRGARVRCGLRQCQEQHHEGFGMMIQMRCIAVLLVMMACSPRKDQGTASEPATTGSSAGTTGAQPSAAAPSRAPWECATDGDCMNSCARGAVNRSWYASAGIQECSDGCNGQLAAPPRCMDSTCVAFRKDPNDATKVTMAPECTKMAASR